jgi:hypothetical protein
MLHKVVEILNNLVEMLNKLVAIPNQLVEMLNEFVAILNELVEVLHKAVLHKLLLFKQIFNALAVFFVYRCCGIFTGQL